jgi:hypothetical protein
MPRGIRAEAIQGERRRRRDADLDKTHHMKLALPAEFANDKEHAYYWANDDNSRIEDLTVRDDWDICTLSGHEAGEGDKVRRQVGTKKTGEALYAYLLRKPMDYYEEDKRKGAERIAKSEQELVSQVPGNIPQATNAYVASGSSIKRRGAYAP